LETRKEKLIQIIISGQPELTATLADKKLVQLAQRIGLRCQTKPLTEKEAHEYIEHRLKAAGYKGPQLFANKAKKMIWAHSEGIPRTINILCDNALLTGYSKDTKRIDSSIVQEVINGLNNVRLNTPEPQKEERRVPSEVRGKPKETRFRLAWAAAIAAAVVIINIVLLYAFMGNVRDVLNELSLKLENVKDRSQYQSEERDLPNDKTQTDRLQRSGTSGENKMDSASDKVPTDRLQRSEASYENKIASGVDPSTTKSIPPPSADGGSSENEVAGGKTGDDNSVVVQKGETLEEIMVRVYRKKDPKLQDAILKSNPEIKNPNLIYENQILRLPSKADKN
jgi:hypothetical protein